MTMPEIPNDNPDAEHPVVPWLTYPRRAWLYRVLGGLALVGVVLGLATAEVVFAFLALAFTLVSTGTAVLNTPRHPEPPQVEFHGHP